MSQNAPILAPHSPVPALLNSKQTSEAAIQQHQQEKSMRQQQEMAQRQAGEQARRAAAEEAARRQP